MPTRREKIEAMLADEPDDTFLQYSLAMELAKEEKHEESLARLKQLYQSDPPYIPAYFMAGQQLAQLDRTNESRTVLREGIEAARTAGDTHAAGEMSEFLAALGAAGE